MMERADLPIDSLVVDPMQSRERSWTGDDADQQLVAAVDDDGLYNDLIVRPLNAVEMGVTTAESTDSVDEDRDESGEDGHSEYAIIAGSRRYHAMLEAGYEKVPCKVLHADDLDAAWTSLLENTDRRELSEQEIAQQLSLIFEMIRPRDSAGAGEVDISQINPAFETEDGRF